MKDFFDRCYYPVLGRITVEALIAYVNLQHRNVGLHPLNERASRQTLALV